MPELSPAQRRSLRARAHTLHPVLMVGEDGLTQGVLAEAERALAAHELIKVRAASLDRDQREQLLQALCERTGASPVQHIGKVLVIYRPNPEGPAFRSSRRTGR
jgi:RNA-binding protein